MITAKERQQLKKDLVILGRLSPEAFKIYVDSKAKKYLDHATNSMQLKDKLSLETDAGSRENVYVPLKKAQLNEERAFRKDAKAISDKLKEEIAKSQGKKKELLTYYANRFGEVAQPSLEKSTPIAAECRDMLNYVTVGRNDVTSVIDNGISLKNGKVLRPFDLMIEGERLHQIMNKYQAAKKNHELSRKKELEYRTALDKTLKKINKELDVWKELKPEDLAGEDRNKLSTDFQKSLDAKTLPAAMQSLSSHVSAYQMALNLGWPISDLNAFATVCDASMREHGDRKKAYINIRAKIVKTNYIDAADPEKMRDDLFVELKTDMENAEKIPAEGNLLSSDYHGIVEISQASALSLAEKENLKARQQIRIRNKNKAENEKPVEEPKAELKEDAGEERKEDAKAVAEPEKKEEVPVPNDNIIHEEPVDGDEEMSDEEMQALLNFEKNREKEEDEKLRKELEEGERNNEPVDVEQFEKELEEEEPVVPKLRNEALEFLGRQAEEVHEDEEVDNELEQLGEAVKQEEQKQEEQKQEEQEEQKHEEQKQEEQGNNEPEIHNNAVNEPENVIVNAERENAAEEENRQNNNDFQLEAVERDDDDFDYGEDDREQNDQNELNRDAEDDDFRIEGIENVANANDRNGNAQIIENNEIEQALYGAGPQIDELQLGRNAQGVAQNIAQAPAVDYRERDAKTLAEYRKGLEDNLLTIHDVQKAREDWAAEAIRRAGEIPDPDDLRRRQYLFQATALANGWNITDMEALDAFVKCVETAPEEAREEGRDLLNHIVGVRVLNRESRAHIFSDMMDYVAERALNAADEAERDNLRSVRSGLIESMDQRSYWAEFPKDAGLVQQANREKKLGQIEFFEDGKKTLGQERDRVIRRQLQAYQRSARLRDEKDRRNVREKNTYILPSMSREELEKWTNNGGRREVGAHIGLRDAAKFVMGGDIYEDTDRKYLGTEEERTVPIHHSMGTKYNNQGSHVLQIDIGGSGYMLPTHEHHGISAWKGKGLYAGTDGETETEKMLREEYGERTPVRGHEKKNLIRRKSSEFVTKDGKKVSKERFFIPGPLALGGTANMGDYSIENTRQVVCRIGEDFLTPIFKRWEAGEEAPSDIRIDITGHSRGGCGAGEGTELLKDWIANHEIYKKYADKVVIDTIQMDPVPGFGDRTNHGRVDYRKNDNAEGLKPRVGGTVIYSMSIDHGDALFRPQEVRNADRVIIGFTSHAVGLNLVDRTQMTVEQDGQAHRRGFYDMETGEFYRGSGISELPEGVYFSDDKQNLLRINSFSQLNELMDVACIGADRHHERQNVLRASVKSWFAGHKITSTYRHPEEREQILQQTMRAEEKIKTSTDLEFGMGAVREHLFILDEARKTKDREQIRAAEDAVVQQCRNFMERAPMNTKTYGRQMRNLELVGDLMSGMQRERNFADNNMQYTKRNEPLAQEEKDRRITADAAKTDAIRSSLKQQVQEFTRKLDVQEKRYGKDQKNSAEYTRMRDALKECSQLDERSSVRDIMGSLSELHSATRYYLNRRSEWNTLKFGRSMKNKMRYAFSASTRQRVNFVRNIEETTNQFMSNFAELAGGVTDKNSSLLEVIAKKSPLLAYGVAEIEQIRKDREKALLEQVPEQVREQNPQVLGEENAEQPKEPKKEDVKNEAPKNEELKKEEPKNEEPKKEEPKREEPKNEEPKKEEPKKEEPKNEEPKKEEPKNEAPKKADAERKDAVPEVGIASRVELPGKPKDAAYEADIASRVELQGEPKDAGQPKNAEKKPQEWSISKGDTMEYHAEPKKQRFSISQEASMEYAAEKKEAGAAVEKSADPEKRVAVHVEGWGESSFLYESKYIKGERKKTDFTSLVQEGKQDVPKKPDYKNLRNEKILEQEDAIRPSGPSVKK